MGGALVSLASLTVKSGDGGARGLRPCSQRIIQLNGEVAERDRLEYRFGQRAGRKQVIDSRTLDKVYDGRVEFGGKRITIRIWQQPTAIHQAGSLILWRRRARS